MASVADVWRWREYANADREFQERLKKSRSGFSPVSSAFGQGRVHHGRASDFHQLS